jgi:hypothetical protein
LEDALKFFLGIVCGYILAQEGVVAAIKAFLKGFVNAL